MTLYAYAQTEEITRVPSAARHAVTKPRLNFTPGAITQTTALTMLAPATYRHDMSIVRPRDYITLTIRKVKRFITSNADENIITGSILAMAAASVIITLIIA